MSGPQFVTALAQFPRSTAQTHDDLRVYSVPKDGAFSVKLSSTMVTAALGAALVLQGCAGGPGGRHGGGFGGGPGGGMAQSREPSRESQLRRFDANADGIITREEFEKVLKSDFATADTTHDNVLNAAEVRAVNERLLTVRDISPIIDWNADGTVSFDEFGAQWQTLFKRADADGNGIVTAEELSRPSGGREGGQPGGGPGGGGRGGPPGGGRPGGGSMN